MDAGAHFGCPKFTFDRISGHYRSIHNFIFIEFLLTNWLPSAILDVRNSLSIAFLAILDQCGFFFTKWPPAPFFDVRNSLSIAFLAILDQYGIFFFWNYFTKWPPADILDVRKSLLIAFLAISDRLAILDVWNSLSIGILAIRWVNFRSIQKFIGFFGRPFCMSENHFRLHFWPFLIDRPYWMSEIHFRWHFWPFQIHTDLNYFLKFLAKWWPAAILDVRK